MAKYALDIFRLLKQLESSRSGDVYSKLTDEQKKSVAPLVIMRWLSGVNDNQQIMLLNTFANRFIFPLGKHPHLLTLVLQACTSKSQNNHKWIGIKSGGKKDKLRTEILMQYFDYSINEVRALTIIPGDDDIFGMAEELGWQRDEIKKLYQELKGKD